MKYIPNQNKICSVCGRSILYNEDYVGKDVLSADGEVQTEIRHFQFCDPQLQSTPLSGTMSISATQSYRQQGTQSIPLYYPSMTPSPLTPYGPYGKSLELPLWKRILRAIFGGKNGEN